MQQLQITNFLYNIFPFIYGRFINNELQEGEGESER